MTFEHNFSKFRPIFKILSPSDSWGGGSIVSCMWPIKRWQCRWLCQITFYFKLFVFFLISATDEAGVCTLIMASGFVRVAWSIFKFWTSLLCLEQVQLGTLILICRLIVTNTTNDKLPLMGPGCVQSYIRFSLVNKWQYLGNGIQDWDIITMEDL